MCEGQNEFQYLFMNMSLKLKVSKHALRILNCKTRTLGSLDFFQEFKRVSFKQI